MGNVKVVRTVAELRGVVAGWRKAGDRIALVPTMGALHSGHLALVTQAKGMAGRVVASIFVNPRQFAPHEDLDRYPRDEAGDVAKLATVGCDLVWAPTPTEMYPSGFATRIEIGGAAEGLETDFRPHFFGGVATVVCKLLSQVTPDVAIFGEKDYQQLCVIRQMVRDLDLPVEIVGGPTVREADGLALSSRNAYLTPTERTQAPELHRALQTVARAVASGGDISAATATARDAILHAGFAKVDYVEVRDAVTLKPPSAARAAAGSGHPLRVLAAAWLGKTRLIDNIGA